MCQSKRVSTSSPNKCTKHEDEGILWYTLHIFAQNKSKLVAIVNFHLAWSVNHATSIQTNAATHYSVIIIIFLLRDKVMWICWKGLGNVLEENVCLLSFSNCQSNFQKQLVFQGKCRYKLKANSLQVILPLN